MLRVGRQGGRGATPLNLLNPTNPTNAPLGPDFSALIPILQNLRRPLDPESGKTVFTSSEAAKIRACGIEARAGTPESTMLALLGHMSGAMLDHYGHIRMAAKRAAVEVLSTQNDKRISPAALQIPLQRECFESGVKNSRY